MSLTSAMDWIVAVLGAAAVILGLLLPFKAGSAINGTLLLITAGAAAYFRMGTWHAPVLAAMGLVLWVVFLWGAQGKGKHSDI
jgi:hypothetical protein